MTSNTHSTDVTSIVQFDVAVTTYRYLSADAFGGADNPLAPDERAGTDQPWIPGQASFGMVGGSA